MRVALCSACVVLTFACAAPREAKMTYAAVFKAPVVLSPVAARPAPAAEKDGAAQAATSLELQSSLVVFAQTARQHRAGARQAAMPAAQLDNWDAVLAATDAFLARSARQTSSYDVVRARVVLEAELELDARAYVQLPPDLAERVERQVSRLAVRMAELRRLKVKPRLLAPDFQWPISPVAVTSLFGKRIHPISGTYRQHQGIDLAAEHGQHVFAAATGTVLRAGYDGSHGLRVELQHAGGVVTRYSHLSDVLVDAGQTVRQGDTVGLAGSTGASTGVHLHFELWRAGVPLDPLEQLGDPAYRAPVPVAER